ncbi:HAD family hydrolase [Paenibacillus glycinis]|uniref:Cof-type HAD-IIB family hydrolase n=1 Tax=Paenibacillus glycinis TaxID=2697035 RepID=A0ABW9XQD9_9BACL|nr:HAD family hydrolase [Paenibacillus glycinis]NBD24849.1 Cof-type HAD-IIB family hydrolase [Paenibacillus glycinis]
MGRKMFFFDFDGTLFSHATKEVPEGNIRALRRLQEQGHAVMVVTGRGAESLRFIQAAIPLSFDAISVLNGQLIYEAGEIAYENQILLASMGHLIRIAKTNRFSYGGYDKNGVVVNGINDRVASVWRNFNAPLPAARDEFEQDTPLYQGHLYITQDEAALFEPYLDDYIANWSDPCLVNLIPKDAGKSQAVRWCMARYGVAREDTFAFGDAFNDKDMLLSVGHGIAMGNGDPSIKELAEFVTKSVDENGIAWALKHYHVLEDDEEMTTGGGNDVRD